MSNLNPSVEDQIAVGTEAILDSPHVTVGPGRVANAPVPSVFVDDRGDIHRLRVGHRRINLLYSKESVMRSGYLHHQPTHDFVVTGKVEVWYLTQKTTEKKIIGPREYFSIPSYVPHILFFLEDTVLVEWWDSSDVQCWYYHPYRKIVDVQNSLVSSSTGRHQLLVPQDYNVDKPLPSNRNNFVYAALGVVFGLVVGVVIGERRRLA
jgi:hypothetical protein